MKSQSNFFLIAFSLLTIIVHLRIDNKNTSDILHDVVSTFDSIPALLSDSFNEKTSSGNTKSENEQRNKRDGKRSRERRRERKGSANRKSSGSGDVGDGSGFCLLIKDDNEILAEWVAYHYHVFNMRRLIVAVDPTSKTSPSKILEPFEKSMGNFDLDLTIWHDEDYTPTWFHSEDVDPASYIRGRKIERNNKIQCGPMTTPSAETRDLGRDIILTCKLRKRQVMFYNECLSKMQTENKKSNSWTALIDSDEYLVPNPWIANYIHQDSHSSLSQNNVATMTSHFQRDELESMFPDKPSAGSLWSLFRRFQETAAAAQRSKLCVMVPRITFGGKDVDADDDADDDDASEPATTSASSSTSTTVWNHKNFETLRWKYHRDHKRRDKPKGILNAAEVDHLDQIKWGENSPKPIMSVHVPHTSCDGTVWEVDNPGLYEQPLAIHHYVGSLEQFLNRGDVRRTVEAYDEKTKATAYAIGDQNDHYHFGGERWWISGWLDEFVETHGREKVYAVLGKNYATTGETAIADRETMVVQKPNEAAEEEESRSEKEEESLQDGRLGAQTPAPTTSSSASLSSLTSTATSTATSTRTTTKQ